MPIVADNLTSHEAGSLKTENEDAVEKGRSVHHETAFKGDESDGKVPWKLKSVIAAMSLAGLYTGSQIMLYFVGGSLSYIERDLGLVSNSSWLPVSNTLAIASVAPFVGYLQDLLGRRNITLLGEVVILAGLVIVGTAHHFGQAVAGMALCGAGAAICELTALAGISDIVPVRNRGLSLALMVSFIFPFTPYVMYSQLLSYHRTWRWTIWLTLIYNGVVFIGVLTTYFPKAHPRMQGVKKSTILREIDYVGAVLSICGITLFLVALQGGGYSRPWTSSYILSQLIVGAVLIFSWVIWEWKFARQPMIPHEIFAGQRAVGLAFFIAMVAGLNFYSLINFFPLTFSTVYSPEPVQIGLRGLGYGISVSGGAAFFNALLSIRQMHCRWVIAIAATIMTVFSGALSVSNPENSKLTVALGTMAGFGVGGILVLAATLAMIVVPDSCLATTAALSLSIRTVGGSIGYSIYYNIFANKLAHALPEYVAEYVTNAGLLPANETVTFTAAFLNASTNITSIPGYTPAIAAAAASAEQWAYAYALKYVWWTSIPFGCLATLASLFLPDIKRYQTNRVAVTL